MEDNLIKNGRFTYLEKGEGPVLLLLHGLFGALSNFNEVIDHFSGKYKVVIPMLPLYEMPILTTGVSSLAKFVEQFVEHQKFDKVILLGNSLGGHISLVYSLKHPKKVDKMILTGSSGLY